MLSSINFVFEKTQKCQKKAKKRFEEALPKTYEAKQEEIFGDQIRVESDEGRKVKDEFNDVTIKTPTEDT